jgi:hypothetical protein
MTKVQEAQAALKAAKAEAKAAKSAKNKRIPLADRPTAPFTTGVSMERREESEKWGVDHAFLRFHGVDDKPHAIGSKLDLGDEEGLALVKEIKEYAAANRVGNSKVRFDPSIGAWKGRADMFPPRLLTIAGYTISK